VPRTVFDARLVAAALAAGAVWRRRTVRSLRSDGESVALDGAAAQRAGGDRRGRGRLGGPPPPRARPQPGRAPGARDPRLRPATRRPQEQRIVTAAPQWPAYAWAFPIGDGRANIGYGEVLRGRPVSRAHLLDRLAALLPDVDVAGATGLRAHLLPLSTRRPPPGRGPVLLAGDALSLINPFTGEGIFYAVRSGASAGAAAAAAVEADAPRTAARRLCRGPGPATAPPSAAQRRRRGAGRRRRMVDAAVRAAREHQAVFDTMVELGPRRRHADRAHAGPHRGAATVGGGRRASWIAGLGPDLAVQARLLDGLLTAVEADPRWEWLELGCSVANGRGDELSDLDLGLGYLDEAALDGVAGMLRGLGPVVDLSAHPYDGVPRWWVQYADGGQIDLVALAAERPAGAGAGRRRVAGPGRPARRRLHALGVAGRAG
jgi:hypothetical protein